MEYAKITNGAVENIILADAEFIAGMPGQWVECTGKDWGVGWLFDGTDAHAPAQPAPAPELRHITPLAFLRRFTKDERAAIEWAAVDRAELSNEQRMQAAALRSDLKDQAQATFIDLDDAELNVGVQTLELAGLIAVGRAAEILSVPVLDVERP